MVLSQSAAYYDLPVKWKHNILIYESILSMINYIQSFYVAIWRSGEYRKLFKNIWKNSKIIKKLSYPKIKDCCVVVVDRSKFSVGFMSTEPRL
ncbi:unnamed protein product [Auanema sp. JU1783]|nr:unnamed protein product [Auanema sp. JU1783]